jgi:hypothetical protein
MSNDESGFSGETTEVNSSPSSDGSEGNGFNPAWNPLLEKLPTEFHNIIAPTLREWDSGVQKRFQDVQSQYAPYKNYVEQKVDPDQINTALQVAQLLRDNPRFVYDKMVEQYGEEWGVYDQGDEDDGADGFDADMPDIGAHPAIQQIQAQQQAIAEFQQAQIEQQEKTKIDAEIERDFAAVSEKYGELSQQDVEMVVSLALSKNVPVTQAADQVFTYAPRQQTAPGHNLPNIVPPGGGVPSQAINPATLDDKATRSLVQSMLKNAFSNNG